MHVWQLAPVVLAIINDIIVSAKECEYRYTRQPPVSLTCNPYNATRLVMRCTADGASTPSFTIIWMRERNGIDRRLNDSHIDVIRLNDGQTLKCTSRLIMKRLNEVDDIGDYWCQVRLQNGTVLLTS